MLTSNTRVTAVVGGINLGVCAFKSGGGAKAEETKYRPGSMLPETSLGGPSSVDNVTIRKMFDPALRALFHTLASMVGKASCTVTSQPLDADGNPEGDAQVYTGVLLEVNPPDSDANANAAAELELVISTHGSIA
jgi:hypothetical protein